MDLVVVIVGISIAFQVDKWDTARRERNFHQILARDLLAELRLNIADFEEVLPALEQTQARMEAIQETYKSDNPRAQTNELIKSVSTLTFIEYPSLKTAQLDNYLSSTVGYAYDVKPLLLSLNSKMEEFKFLQQYNIEIRLQKLPDKLSGSIDYVNKKLIDPEPLFAVQFKNFFMLMYTADKEWIRSYHDLLMALKESEIAISKLVDEQ